MPVPNDSGSLTTTRPNSSPFDSSGVRVSMGTVFQVPRARLETWPGGLADLRDAGFTVAALALAADVVSLADLVVRIPMAAGVDSLNVAAASAVAFWATRT